MTQGVWWPWVLDTTDFPLDLPVDLPLDLPFPPDLPPCSHVNRWFKLQRCFPGQKVIKKCDTQNPQLNLGHSRLPSPWHGFFGIISWLLREFLHAHYLCFRKVDVTHNSSLAAHLDAKSPSKTESEVGPRSEDTHVEVEVCKYGFHDMSIQRLLDWGNSDKHPYF